MGRDNKVVIEGITLIRAVNDQVIFDTLAGFLTPEQTRALNAVKFKTGKLVFIPEE